MRVNQAVAARIRELCREQNMTQYQLFKASGVSQSTISNILNCAFPSMKLRIIYEICEGFQISLEEFFHSPLFDRENLED